MSKLQENQTNGDIYSSLLQEAQATPQFAESAALTGKACHKVLELVYLMLHKSSLDDATFTFYYHDVPISFYLPTVPHDFIENTILTQANFFEAPLLEAAAEYIPKGATVLDIGANIGNHSVYCSKILGCAEIIAFDPQRRACEIFRRNMEINGITKYTLHQKGVGKTASKADGIAWRSGNRGATAFAATESGNIDIVALDDLVLPKVDFMKVDVEGMELEVFFGGKQLIQRDRPVIWLEYGSTEVMEHYTILLNKWGYSLPILLDETNMLAVPQS